MRLRGGVGDWLRGAAAFFAAALAFSGAAAAADLRIEFKELAAIAQRALGGATLRLHNAPSSGFLDFTQGSYVAIGSTQVPIAIPVRTFPIAGGNYAYYVNDINSTSVSFEPVSGAVRLTLRFEGNDPELVGRCRSGLCAPVNALPRIEWSDASVAIDLAPVGVGDSVSLEAKAVKIGGNFAPSCSPSAALISGEICRAVLAKARQAIVRLRGDLDTMLREQVNKPEIQANIAAELKKRLVLGPAGELRIRSVGVSDSAVTISFCLACAG